MNLDNMIEKATTKKAIVGLNCASSLEEIQIFRKRLEYKRKLADAVLSETHRALKIMLGVDELNDQSNPRINFLYTELPFMLNILSQSLVEFMNTDFIQQARSVDPEQKEKICKQLRFQSSVFRILLQHLELQIVATSETLEQMEASIPYENYRTT